jgi:exo-beta-1,3-glucanase (GH17 family)
MRRFTPFILFVPIALATIGLAWLYHQPRSAGPDVPTGKLKSVSFAPFREGYSPLQERFPPREHLEEDIALLAPQAESIRTYSSLGGMEPLPDIARKHGVTVTQGAWLGWGEKDNQREIAALIASANQHPDVVTRVIVGNEVLLRGEMEAPRLLQYINTVKRSIAQPVSYADVWSMYLKHPEIIAAVDFITIHILPYWEDEPIAIDVAPEHLERVFRAVEAEARELRVTKPILIGESGWPSLGRQRGFAVPSVLNAARYTRGMIAVATRHNFDYNIVEAFNQPWKAELEGIVGANWGLFSEKREPVYPLTGDVTENTAWRYHLGLALVLALTALGLLAGRLSNLSPTRQALGVALAVALGVSFLTSALYTYRTSFAPLDRFCGALLVALTLIFAALVLIRVLDVLGSNRDRLNPVSHMLSWSFIAFVLLALWRTYSLAWNGRYLSFPLEQFLTPVTGLIGLAIAGAIARDRKKAFRLSDLVPLGSPHQTHRRWLGWGLVIGIVGLFGGETAAFLHARDLRAVYPTLSEAIPVALTYTFGNTQLVAWVLYLALFAVVGIFSAKTSSSSAS